MKTVNEWIVEFKKADACGVDVHEADKIESIQLDAFKAGMHFAANQIGTFHFTNDPELELVRQANDLKELP